MAWIPPKNYGKYCVLESVQNLWRSFRQIEINKMPKQVKWTETQWKSSLCVLCASVVVKAKTISVVWDVKQPTLNENDFEWNVSLGF